MFFSRSPHEFRRVRSPDGGEGADAKGAQRQRVRRSRRGPTDRGRQRKGSGNAVASGRKTGIDTGSPRASHAAPIAERACAASGMFHVKHPTSQPRMSHEEHLVSRPDCVTGNNPRRTSNVSRETIRAERRLGAREEPPHQSEQHLHQDQDKRHGEQEQEHALRRGSSGELRVRAVLLGQNDVERAARHSKQEDADRSHQRVDPGHEREDDRSQSGQGQQPICLSPHPTASCATFRSRL